MRAIWSGAVSFGLVSVPIKVVLGDDEPRRAVPPGARRRRRPHPVPADLRDLRGGRRVRGHRQGLRHARGRADHARRERSQLASGLHRARDRRHRVRAVGPDRPAAVRQELLPRAGDEGRQALRPAARGAQRDRPDGRGQGRAAPARDDRAAAGARQGHRAADDALAGRGPGAGVRHPGHRRRAAPAGAADGVLARGEHGCGLRPGRLPRRVPRRRRRADRVQEGARRRPSRPGRGEARRRRGLDERPAVRAAGQRGRRAVLGRRRQRQGEVGLVLLHVVLDLVLELELVAVAQVRRHRRQPPDEGSSGTTTRKRSGSSSRAKKTADTSADEQATGTEGAKTTTRKRSTRRSA